MKCKFIIATWLALLPLCLIAQIQQVKSSYSNGNQAQNGNVYVAGIPATNANNIKNTGYSTTIGFLAMEELDGIENLPPIADAGADQLLLSSDKIVLDGSASFDPNGDELSYTWVSLSDLELDGSNSVNPFYSAVEVKAIQTFRFVLMVNDGELSSNPDTVAVTVRHPDWIAETATNSATFYGLVTFNENNAEEDDIVAAYIDGVNRGVSNVKIIQNQPYVIFNIQADMEGEATFKLYDASEDRICEVEESTVIIPGFDIGTPDAPILLDGNCSGGTLVPISPNPDPTCKIEFSNTVICAGKTVTAEFDCVLPPNYTYEWQFDSAIVLSGDNLGPYELKWETSGTKKVSILTYNDGNLVSTLSQPIEVQAVDLIELNISICKGESYTFDGETFTQPTFYIGEFTNQNGCDSLVLLNLIVEDKMCQQRTFYLSGNIVTEDLMPVKEVMVEIINMDGMMKKSNSEGDYSLNEIPYHSDSIYTIKPIKNTNPLNGVSSYDLVLISKFILGLHEFDSPYQYIAADINKSGTITAVDAVELRQLMLDMIPTFSNNTSWRFVDANFDFPSIKTTNPLSIDFPETIIPTEIPTDSIGHNFIAVKIGDINGNARADSRISNSTSNKFEISLEEKTVIRGQTVKLNLTGAVDNLDGFQFTLEFDPNLLSIIDIEEKLLSKENIGITRLNEGLLSVSWTGTSEINELLTFTIKAKANITTNEVLKISNISLKAEAYDKSGNHIGIDLIFFDSAKDKELILFQNEPNPFKNDTQIRFFLPEAREYQLKILTINGKIINEIYNQGKKGINEITIHHSILNNSGMYYYQLISGNQQLSKKMIRVE